MRRIKSAPANIAEMVNRRKIETIKPKKISENKIFFFGNNKSEKQEINTIKNIKNIKNCTLKRTKITKNTVDARVLHSKMPYIWRFLKPNTRKYMIKLANKPVENINIPFHIYPGRNLQSSKNIRKVTKNMTQKNKRLYRKLRQEYKNI